MTAPRNPDAAAPRSEPGGLGCPDADRLSLRDPDAFEDECLKEMFQKRRAEDAGESSPTGAAE